jgi:hypothetical protein
MMRLVGVAVVCVLAGRAIGATAFGMEARGPVPADVEQAARPAVVDRLMGEWHGAGTVLGRSASITMVWELAVGDAFVRLRFRNEMAAGAAEAAAVLEAHGYYRFGRGPMNNRGTWIDSRGVVLPVVITIGADALTSDWGDERSEVGRTVYRLIDARTLEVVDSVRQADGQYREFGRSQLKLASVPASHQPGRSDALTHSTSTRYIFAR